MRRLPKHLTDHLAQPAGAFPVNNTHEWQPGQVSRLKVAIQRIYGIFCALSAQIQFHTWRRIERPVAAGFGLAGADERATEIFTGSGAGSVSGSPARCKSPWRARTRRFPTCTSKSVSLIAVITPSILIDRTRTLSPSFSGERRSLAQTGVRPPLRSRTQRSNLLLQRFQRFQRLARAR